MQPVAQPGLARSPQQGQVAAVDVQVSAFVIQAEGQIGQHICKGAQLSLAFAQHVHGTVALTVGSPHGAQQHQGQPPHQGHVDFVEPTLLTPGVFQFGLPGLGHHGRGGIQPRQGVAHFSLLHRVGLAQALEGLCLGFTQAFQPQLQRGLHARRVFHHQSAGQNAGLVEGLHHLPLSVALWLAQRLFDHPLAAVQAELHG